MTILAVVLFIHTVVIRVLLLVEVSFGLHLSNISLVSCKRIDGVLDIEAVIQFIVIANLLSYLFFFVKVVEQSVIFF
jgi:hypothetical protein